MKKIYVIFTVTVIVCALTVSLVTVADARPYEFKFSNSWQYTTGAWLGGEDFDMFITVDNGGTSPADTFTLDDFQRYELRSDSYIQTWDLTEGTLSYNVVDMWKITYDGVTATWSIGDCASCPPSLNVSIGASLNGATDNANGSDTPVGFDTSFYNLTAPVDWGSSTVIRTSDDNSWAYLFDHTGEEASLESVNLSGALVPEPVSSTLFVIGAATMGYRRFRMRKK